MISLKQSLLCLVLMVIISGCGSFSSRENSAAQDIPPDTLITLRRTTCLGTCPAYELSVSANGDVLFIGEKFVREIETVQSRISQDALRELISAFAKAQYFSLKDSYDGSEDGCPEFGIDAPSVTTSIRINGQHKSVFHDLGCTEIDYVSVFPKQLTELEDQIDEIVGTDKWIR